MMKNAKNRAKKASALSGRRVTLPTAAQCCAWLALALFTTLTIMALAGRDRVTTAVTEIAQVEAPQDPTYLSPADRGLYAMIEAAQASKKFDLADSLLRQLSNRGLVSYVLAERYLSGDYAADKTELTQWLAAYADHPYASRIANLARTRGHEVSHAKPAAPLRGDGYGDHQGRSTMPDRWFTALGHWREGEYAQAATIFNALSEDDSLSDWQQAATHFWAYRAAEKRGQKEEAATHLAAASQFESTFYGLLARATKGVTNIETEAPEVSDALRRDPRAIRAALLAQMYKAEAAETELRALYSAVGERDRRGVVTLASELNLPNLQLRLARTPGLSDAEKRFAQYPMPHYMLALDAVMDPALLMAVARNESGFRDAVNKSSGATGMMQMLPSTARAVERHVGQNRLRIASASNTDSSIAERLSDPALSARYGAEYLRLIAAEPAINHNLIQLLIGYNAGPGTAASWKAAGRNVSDPLLYIESIPYPETRNYVMQVSAQYWIYQMMMDETPTTLKTLARGEWPSIGAAPKNEPTI